MKQSGALKQLIDCLGHRKYDVKYIALDTLIYIIKQSDNNNDKMINNFDG